ncbi:MAG: glutamate-5-semialdehyde dehydrogenase [Sneathiella sp.]|jgi:glutamate-5-semialdehyde dehydrogenase|uniref:glutamate-5-semialdehyde dehydrogenase n=1 Tax=Sneathiella sp. TaxID=1964365 RepID=UPI000C4BF79A|nr:glutamate-5-semialdehyde dehydrogenase [Sneathiella sp.]MAL78928.1 glutamate-5-semialdehyde dehydrogenase [Sneathiella sp.]
MTAQPQLNRDGDIAAMMEELGRRARKAAKILSLAPTEAKNQALIEAAKALRARKADILAANEKDLIAGRAKGLTAALLDRLELNDNRIEAMAAGLDAIAELPDPVGDIMTEWERPNGLQISRVRVPLGVIGIIYESRPNVTADAGALCLKAGNACILRGGSESYHSSRAIWSCLQDGLSAAALPVDAIQMIETTDRAAVGALLTLSDYVDVIVPRGGRSLIERVQKESRIPVFSHLDGLVHIYIDAKADPAKARQIVLNSKMRRVSICGALETLLVSRSVAETLLPEILNDLIEAGCEIRGDEAVRKLDTRVGEATEEDWRTEYLEPILSVRIVEDLAAAIEHIETYGSHHTDCIITEDAAAARRFMQEVDSAIVLQNASTQFADGGEFGMGAEIGISTGKMHARGPVGVEQLTSFKYIVRGDGQTRP